MPEIFDQLEAFESWFDFSALKEKDGHKEILVGERKNHIVSSLHAILKPFLLRRVKADVETTLPKKREYVLYAPLTTEQKELYRHILDGTSRAYLEEKVMERITGSSGASTPKSTKSLNLKRKVAGSGTNTPNKSVKSSRSSTPAGSVRSRTSKKRMNYREKSDVEFFRDMEQGPESEEMDEEEQEAVEHAKTIALASKYSNLLLDLSPGSCLAYNQLQRKRSQARNCKTRSCNSDLRATHRTTSTGPGRTTIPHRT